MAYEPHLLVQFGGGLGDVEQWSCNIRIANPTQAALDALFGTTDLTATHFASNMLSDVATDVSNWFATARHVHALARLQFLKFNAIGADGRYVDKANTNEHVYDPYVTGPSTGSAHPFQCSLVASLVTAKARGRAHKGRIFLPLPTCGITNTGQITASDATEVATDLAALLRALNNWPGVDPGSADVSVFSKLDATRNAVKSVQVGTVIDTLRRRRRSLNEAPPPAVAL